MTNRFSNFARFSTFAELTKPRITSFILMSAAIGFLFGSHLAPALELVRADQHAGRYRPVGQRNRGAESVV